MLTQITHSSTPVSLPDSLSLPVSVPVSAFVVDVGIDRVIEVMREHIDTWLLPPLDSPRALSPAALAEKLAAHGARDVRQCDSLDQAWRLATSLAGENDRITVFGSFYTVAGVMQARLAARQ